MRIEKGVFTPTSDIASSQVYIPHSLGVVPDFIVAIGYDFPYTEATTEYCVNGICFPLKWIPPTTNPKLFIGHSTTSSGGTRFLYEGVANTKFTQETTFRIPFYNVDFKLKSGIQYKYVIGVIE